MNVNSTSMARHADCVRGASGPEAEFILPANSRTYGAGNILSLKESVNRVVQEEILERTAHELGISLSKPEDFGNWDRTGRPAAIMNACRRTRSEDPIPVCLLATFHGAGARALLSLVMQHFCATVFPHDAIPEEPGEAHFHTHPEWLPERCGKKNTWIILFRFKSPAEVSKLWRNLASENEDMSKASSFTMNDENLVLVKTKSMEVWRQWINRCTTDEEYLRACLREYKVRMTLVEVFMMS